MEWESVRDYHDFVFFAIEKDKFEEIMNDENVPEEFKQILRDARNEYKWRNLNKRRSSVAASRARVKKAYRKCAIALKKLIDDDIPVTPYQIHKNAGVHYNTAKKFIERYKDDIKEKYLDYILDDLDIDISKL